MPNFIFSKKTGKYRYASNGHVVSDARIAGWIDQASKVMAEEMARAANDLRAGRINDAEWAIRSTDAIKRGHRAVAMIGAGGKANMTASDWGFVGGIVRRELQYFARFAAEIESRPDGAILTDAFVSRAKSYGAAIYSTHQQMVARRVQRDGTAQFERNVLEPGAEHCDGCIAQTALGKVPIGTLVHIGHRDCKMRCRCHIEYS